jgi:hypothetical protein
LDHFLAAGRVEAEHPDAVAGRRRR